MRGRGGYDPPLLPEGVRPTEVGFDPAGIHCVGATGTRIHGAGGLRSICHLISGAEAYDCYKDQCARRAKQMPASLPTW